jgi:AraC-like DNA-binding protein
MNKKVLKAPQGLILEQHNLKMLKMNGFSVIESCIFTKDKKGFMFLEDHLLLFVLSGTYTVYYGNESYTVRKNEMVLLQKSIVIQYQKSGEPDSEDKLDYMLFFLKDELLKEFIKMSNIKFVQPKVPVPISVKPVSECMIKYLESIKPYFRRIDKVEDNLIKIKLLELLFDLAYEDNNIMDQLMQLKQQVHSDITKVVEENVMNPVSINDLAYLSGRSLSSFKRDFQSIYNIPPSKWIKERRLQKAKELLTNTSMSVTDICFTIGFENATHFSRIFREHFGYSPSSYKQHLSLM